MINRNSEQWIKNAKSGTRKDIDNIMISLNDSASLVDTRSIDHALSFVDNEEGFDAIKYYLFNGTQIQRNYSALYFGRLGEYPILREAYDKGLIDEKQAFSR